MICNGYRLKVFLDSQELSLVIVYTIFKHNNSVILIDNFVVVKFKMSYLLLLLFFISKHNTKLFKLCIDC